MNAGAELKGRGKRDLKRIENVQRIQIDFTNLVKVKIEIFRV